MSESPVRKPGRIGLCAYSLRHRIRCEQPWLRLFQLDLPREAKNAFSIDTVELYSGFLESTDRRYLDRIRQQADECGVCLHGMAVDAPYGDLCAADETARKIAVAQNMVYAPAAQRLGLAYYRVNTGGESPTTPKDIEQAIKSFRELTAVAWDLGVRMAIENHGGLSLDPAAVAQVIETVGRDRMATLPDLGNFGSGADAYEKIGRLAPYAVAVHAKVYNFTDAGEAGNIDFGRMAKVVAAAGGGGPWSIETAPPDAARTNETVLKSKALIEKYVA